MARARGRQKQKKQQKKPHNKQCASKNNEARYAWNESATQFMEYSTEALPKEAEGWFPLFSVLLCPQVKQLIRNGNFARARGRERDKEKKNLLYICR